MKLHSVLSNLNQQVNRLESSCVMRKESFLGMDESEQKARRLKGGLREKFERPDKISHKLAFILRHDTDYIRHTDAYGWVRMELVLQGLNKFFPDADERVSRDELSHVIASQDNEDRRYEITGSAGEEKVRCFQGHDLSFYKSDGGNIEVDCIFRKLVDPVEYLFHSTKSQYVESILLHGLKFQVPEEISKSKFKAGRFVHMWDLVNSAKKGRKNCDAWIKVDMKRAMDDHDINFYIASNGVILSIKEIPCDCLQDFTEKMPNVLEIQKERQLYGGSGYVEETFDAEQSCISFKLVDNKMADDLLLQFADDLRCHACNADVSAKIIELEQNEELLAERLKRAKASTKRERGSKSDKEAVVVESDTAVEVSKSVSAEEILELAGDCKNFMKLLLILKNTIQKRLVTNHKEIYRPLKLLLKHLPTANKGGDKSPDLRDVDRSEAKLESRQGENQKPKEPKPISLNIKFHTAPKFGSDSGLYLIMINGFNDQDLISLAKLYNFPRGCPVFWEPRHYIDFRGFYPKFDLVQKKEREYDFNSEFEGATKLHFFKKWSGFLLHILGFKYKGKYYWTVCTKKNADPGIKGTGKSEYNPYISWGIEAFMKYVSLDLVKELADNHLYLGGEALHVNDVHGYIPKCNDVVITCVGNGSYSQFRNIAQGEDEIDSKQKLTRIHSTVGTMQLNVQSNLVEYMDSESIVRFCETQLPMLQRDRAITVTGESYQLKAFMEYILSNRDTLTNSSFERMLKSMLETDQYGSINVSRHGADHAAIAGDALEGFVMNLEAIRDGTSSKMTVKVKLPIYTWRTFFLRKWIQKLSLNEVGSNVIEHAFIGKKSMKLMEQYVYYWCVSEHGKEIYRQKMKSAAVLLSEMSGNTTHTTHVEIADKVDAMSDSLSIKAATFDHILKGLSAQAGRTVTICLCLGPIGSGKSTIMRRIAACAPDVFECIDGDLVGGKDTENLSVERAPLTLGKVWDAVLRGKVPIISQGGGIFARPEDEDTESVFQSRCKKIFRRDVHLVVVLMRNVHADYELDELKGKIRREKFYDVDPLVEQAYAIDAKDMASVIQGRIDRNELAVGSKVETFVSKSETNKQFAAGIAKDADEVFSVPYDPKLTESAQSGVFGPKQAYIDGAEGIELILQALYRNPGYTGWFGQVRAVVYRSESVVQGKTERFESYSKHITLKYWDHLHDMTAADMTNIKALFPADSVLNCEHHLIFMKGEDGKRYPLSVAAVPSLFESDLIKKYAHITENSGIFNPGKFSSVVEWLYRPDIAGPLNIDENGKKYSFTREDLENPATYKQSLVVYKYIDTVPILHEDGKDAFQARRH